jgi:FkbM family methyltransferase
MSLLKSVARLPVQGLLRIPALRRRVIFELTQQYFAELQIRVPLMERIHCPVPSPDAWYSFTEIFVRGDYQPAFHHIPLPGRWIDLGCHAGYFSLFVLWLRARAGLAGPFQALLVDADRRVSPGVEILIRENRLTEHFKFVYGAIASGRGVRTFQERGQMASAIVRDAAGEPSQAVPILTPDKILEAFPPPYDLIKVDIEGAEFDFLADYGPVLQQAKHLLLEWHSWQTGSGQGADGALPQIEAAAQQAGFGFVADIVPPQAVMLNQSPQQCGVKLYRKV